MTAVTETQAIGCTTGPAWCVSHNHGIHCGEVHWHGRHENGDRVLVRLLQSETEKQARIWVNGVAIDTADPQDAAQFASLMSLLGHYELAATVKRLAEVADAENLTGATT